MVMDGVLGGTMGFYDSDGIRVLGRKWVVADFEDGHKMGKALLTYEVEEKGKIWGSLWALICCRSDLENDWYG